MSNIEYTHCLIFQTIGPQGGGIIFRRRYFSPLFFAILFTLKGGETIPFGRQNWGRGLGAFI